MDVAQCSTETRLPMRLRFPGIPAKCYDAARFQWAVQASILRPDGEIGRHRRLKISRLNGRAGSIPAPGTNSQYFSAELDFSPISNFIK